MENIENKVPNGENQDTQNSSFFSENVSSSNGLEAYPRLRFKAYLDAWNISPLKDLASYGNKRTSVNKRHFISTENMLQNFQGIEQYVDETVVSGVKFEKNDILLANIRPYLRKVWYATFDGAASTDVLAIHTNKQNSLFLKYIIANDKFIDYVMGAAKGCKMPRGDKNFIMDYKVGYPSLPEQQKIANFLSLVDQRIEKQRQLVEALKKYKRGLLYLFFETKKPNKKLSELIKIGKAGGTPLSSNPNYYNGKIPFLSISDMTNQGKYLYSTDKYISDEGLSNSAAWLVPINSLIISMYASYGLVAINKIELSTSQAMFNIIPQEPNDIEFLYYYLSYLSFTGYYDKMVSTGTQPNLNAEKIKNIPIYIPLDKKEKEKISNMLLTFEDKEKQAQKILSNLEQLKNGLLQQMFI